MAAPTTTYLTTEEVAQRYRTSASTVRYWRHAGKGPAGFRLGSRVLYDLDVVEKWEREQQAAQYPDTQRGGAA